MSAAGVSIRTMRQDDRRDAFACGVASLDDFIRESRVEDAHRIREPIFVAAGGEQPVAVGYYSIKRLMVRLARQPNSTLEVDLPDYPYARTVLIQRLAVDRAYQGRGLGEMLLMDALGRIVAASETADATAVMAYCGYPNALEFLDRYGFTRFGMATQRMFLPVATAAEVLAA